MRNKIKLDAGFTLAAPRRAQRTIRVAQPADSTQPATGRLSYREVLRRSASRARSIADQTTPR